MERGSHAGGEGVSYEVRIGGENDEVYVLDQTHAIDIGRPKERFNGTNVSEINCCAAFVPKKLCN